jgi:hypothetical protein
MTKINAYITRNLDQQVPETSGTANARGGFETYKVVNTKDRRL